MLYSTIYYSMYIRLGWPVRGGIPSVTEIPITALYMCDDGAQVVVGDLDRMCMGPMGETRRDKRKSENISGRPKKTR